MAEPASLRGSLWIFVLYDVADEIRLDQLSAIVGVEPVPRQPAFKHPAPDYVRFERPPVIQYLDPVVLETGELFQRRIKYFDYGVISVELEMRFEADWERLIRISSRWITAPELETRSADLVKTHVERVRAALVQPYQSWLSEDYYIIQLNEVLDSEGHLVDAPGLLDRNGGQIAQIVRGEAMPLSAGERREVLQASLSYYPTDLIVVGWVAALIFDHKEGAE